MDPDADRDIEASILARAAAFSRARGVVHFSAMATHSPRLALEPYLRALGLPVAANAAMLAAFGERGSPRYLSLAIVLTLGFLAFEAPRRASAGRFSARSAMLGAAAMGVYALLLAVGPHPIPAVMSLPFAQASARAVSYGAGLLFLADALCPLAPMVAAAWASQRSRALAGLIAVTFVGYRFGFAAEAYWSAMCAPTCSALRATNHVLRPELTANLIPGDRCELAYGDFRVDVGYGCGGSFAIAVMLFGVAFMAIEQPARFRGLRWLPFGLGGVVVMLLANLLRIELILFLGLWSARAFGYAVAGELVRGLFHSNAGLVVYGLATSVYFYLALPSAGGGGEALPSGDLSPSPDAR
jgi:exosortase/archaeosortase family protein